MTEDKLFQIICISGSKVIEIYIILISSRAEYEELVLEISKFI